VQKYDTKKSDPKKLIMWKIKM